MLSNIILAMCFTSLGFVFGAVIASARSRETSATQFYIAILAHEIVEEVGPLLQNDGSVPVSAEKLRRLWQAIQASQDELSQHSRAA